MWLLVYRGGRDARGTQHRLSPKKEGTGAGWHILDRKLEEGEGGRVVRNLRVDDQVGSGRLLYTFPFLLLLPCPKPKPKPKPPSTIMWRQGVGARGRGGRRGRAAQPQPAPRLRGGRAPWGSPRHAREAGVGRRGASAHHPGAAAPVSSPPQTYD
jgi:hypothetical protein